MNRRRKTFRAKAINYALSIKHYALIKALSIKHCALIMALCINVACTSDEDASQLPAGKTPMVFTANGISVGSTRSTVDGDWKDLSSTDVKVKIGNDVKTYTITPSSDNTTATLSVATGETPFYWESATEEKSVKAWYPTTASEDGTTFTYDIASNQSGDGYANSDIIAAADDVTYKNSILEFKHQVAKITVNLKAGGGVTDNDLESATFEIYDGKQYITPYTEAYTSEDYPLGGCVLVNPNQAPTSDDNFVKITLSGGNVFVGSLPTAPTWDANNAYTYTFTVSYDGVTFEGVTIGAWDNPTTTDIEGKMKKIINLSKITVDDITEDYIESKIDNGTLTVIGEYSEDKMKVIAKCVREEEHVSEDEEFPVEPFQPISHGITTVDLSGVKGMEKLTVTFDENGYVDDAGTSFCYSPSLQKVILPTTVTDITRAFVHCEKLTTVEGLESVTKADRAFEFCTALTEAPDMPSLTSLVGTFLGTNITEYKNDKITKYGEYAFGACEKLTTVALPDITSIGAYAFYGCYSLTSITIPSSVTSIGGYAFWNSGLTSITIPSSVTSIGNGAFLGCKTLVTVKCEAKTPPTLETKLFGYYDYVGENYNLTYPAGFKIIVPSESLSAYQEKWSTYKDYITTE